MTKKHKLIKSFMEAERMSRLPVVHSASGYAMIHIIPPRLGEVPVTAKPPKKEEEFCGPYF